MRADHATHPNLGELLLLRRTVKGPAIGIVLNVVSFALHGVSLAVRVERLSPEELQWLHRMAKGKVIGAAQIVVSFAFRGARRAVPATPLAVEEPVCKVEGRPVIGTAQDVASLSSHGATHAGCVICLVVVKAPGFNLMACWVARAKAVARARGRSRTRCSLIRRRLFGWEASLTAPRTMNSWSLGTQQEVVSKHWL